MMTKKFLLCLITLSLSYPIWSQKQQNAIGDFDNDNLSDTLYYKDYRFVDEYRNKDISYVCRVVKGNGKIFDFNLPLGYDFIQFFKCDKDGCIGTYQWKTGDSGFETNETYIYNKEYDNWILERSETVYKEGKKEVYKPKVPTGIDGKEYKIVHKSNLNDFSGIYYLKSCKDSRFTIIITKKQKIYYYSIFDNEKTISKGKMILNKNDFYLGKIKGVFCSGNLQIENYNGVVSKLSHFTQCDEKYLTFLKKS